MTITINETFEHNRLPQQSESKANRMNRLPQQSESNTQINRLPLHSESNTQTNRLPLHGESNIQSTSMKHTRTNTRRIRRKIPTE